MNREKDQALQNINDAQTNDNVSEAESIGNRAIQQVALNVRKKQEAIETINTHAQQQKQQIQANNNSTTEEKEQAEQNVDEAVANAIQNINRSNTNADVDDAQRNGDNTITAITPATKVKDDARAAIEAKVTAQLQQINSNNITTTEEKEVAINN